jgi:hypothetical protein
MAQRTAENNHATLRRNIESERQVLADLQAIAATCQDKIAMLESEVQRDLAGVDLNDLESLARQKAELGVELSAQRLRREELQRRIQAQERKVSEAVRAEKSERCAAMAREQYQRAHKLIQVLREIVPEMELLFDMEKSREIREGRPTYQSPIAANVFSAIQHAIAVYDKEARWRHEYDPESAIVERG